MSSFATDSQSTSFTNEYNIYLQILNNFFDLGFINDDSIHSNLTSVRFTVKGLVNENNANYIVKQDCGGDSHCNPRDKKKCKQNKLCKCVKKVVFQKKNLVVVV